MKNKSLDKITMFIIEVLVISIIFAVRISLYVIGVSVWLQDQIITPFKNKKQ